MKLLITGATGFVGSHLVDAMGAGKDGYAARALVRETSDPTRLEDAGFETAVGDLRDRPSLQDALQGVQTVLHLGALTRARTEREFRQVNEEGTRLLLDAALASGTCTRFVYVSSLAAAGPAREEKPVTAEDEPRPLTAYGRSKLAGETLCQEAAGGMEIVILRPPAVYGPRDRDLLPFFRLAGLGLLPVPAGPARRIQMIHVSDLARGILASLHAPAAQGVYHLAEDTAYEWVEILDLMAKALGVRGRVIPIPHLVLEAAGTLSGGWGRVFGRPRVFDRDKVRELLAPGWLCDTDRARDDLGFTANIHLAGGLKQTASWYQGEGWLR